MKARFEPEGYQYKRYFLHEGHRIDSQVVVADTVDDAVKFAKAEAKRSGKTLRLTDYAVRFVAEIKPDGTLGYNGQITRYEDMNVKALKGGK